MSDRHALPPYSLRMTSELRHLLEDSAKKAKRSLNAEILARLEETFDIEETLNVIAPGASVTGTAGLLEDMHSQLDEREEEGVGAAMSAATKKLNNHIEASEQRLSSIERQLKKVLELLNSSA